MVQGITLSRSSLTALIALSILIPVACGLGLAIWVQKIPEPPLHAVVRMDRMWIEPTSSQQAQRLVPAVTVKNVTQEPWRNLSIGLNKRFYAQEPKGIPAGGTVTLPLEAFIARNGSVRFPPHQQDVTHVTVFAQIGTGARAVSEFDIPSDALGIATAPRKDADAGWIEPNAPKPSPR
ncbi:MAG: hypothetical protein MUF23_13775 [Pirellula sp.]|jgi:hypothetical protein|nr:hypothetical protein [Pirellula sp.]